MQVKKILPFEQNILNQRHGNKIIPFPGITLTSYFEEDLIRSKAPSPSTPCTIIMAEPGEKIKSSIPDFRPLLQRDGLILLSWDKRFSNEGYLYTAYWVTSTGILRYYASSALYIEDFPGAMPCRKSYAAEDGIDFYGETGPEYIVHVAPELMMSNNEKQIQRPMHIKKLKALGIKVNFDYSFLLTAERKKRIFRQSKGTDALA